MLFLFVRFCLLLAAGLLASPALAETENFKEYGECAVATERDDFTDKVRYHLLYCTGKAENRLRNSPTFFIACGGSEGDNVMLNAEEPDFTSEATKRVKYRWGKGKVYEERALNGSDGRSTFLQGSEVVDRFLEGMSSTNRLVFQVGISKSIIPITKTDRAAIPDFKARCGKE